MRYRMWVVDVFASEIFRGNPAAVVLLSKPIDEKIMSCIAAENNLSETAFVRKVSDKFDLRWFSPNQEVDFCGHATLATAHILRTERGYSGQLSFITRAGRISVEPLTLNSYRLDIPRLDPKPLKDTPRALTAILEQSLSVFMNKENYFVELANEAAVNAFVPDLALATRSAPLRASHYGA